MRFILRIIFVATAILLAAYWVPGIVIESFWPTAVLASLFFSLLNTTIKPILRIISFPINFITLGLFTFVINAWVFWMLTFLHGVSINSFISALLGSIIVSIVKMLTEGLTHKKKKK